MSSAMTGNNGEMPESIHTHWR